MGRQIRIIYRKNLKMTPGKLAAQSVHAALGLKTLFPQLTAMDSVVVLQASDAKFEQIKLEHKGDTFELGTDNECDCYVVKDKGLTEVLPGTETVLAFFVEE